MTTKVLDLNNIERKLFWLLSALFVGLIAFYLYSILVVTVNGVERDQMTRASRTLALTMSDLETEYFSIQNSITLVRAESIGLHEVAPKFAGADTHERFSMAR